MRRHAGRRAVISGLAALALVGCAGVPRLRVAEPVIDLGQIRYGEDREHRIALANSGSADLEIVEVRLEPALPDGCT